MNWELPDPPVLQASAIIGATSAALGCFAVLRRQSLLGDTVAHAALPGVCLAYLLTGSKDTLALLCGALAAGILGTLLVLAVMSSSRLKQDAALGIVLSTFFGLGIILLTFFQNRPDYGQSGLDHFIFGQAAYLTGEHVAVMLWFSAGVFAVLALLYKEFKLVSFDPDYTATLGFRRRGLDVLISLLIVVAVMISLRAVGVVLTVALLIAPAAAARQWTHRLSLMIFLAMAFGVVSALTGAVWSQNVANTPTGPAVVLVASMLLVLSLALAPQRGLLWNWLRLREHRRKVRRENLLSDFYRLGERERNWQRTRTLVEVAGARGQDTAPLVRTLQQLRSGGFVEEEDGGWRLSAAGLQEATRVVRNHRLWELYLSRSLDLPPDHVHRDAEEMEHALPPEIVAELEATLMHPETDPHGNPIPRVTAANS